MSFLDNIGDALKKITNPHEAVTEAAKNIPGLGDIQKQMESLGSLQKIMGGDFSKIIQDAMKGDFSEVSKLTDMVKNLASSSDPQAAIKGFVIGLSPMASMLPNEVKSPLMEGFKALTSMPAVSSLLATGGLNEMVNQFTSSMSPKTEEMAEETKAEESAPTM
jgi:hypothetical protein